MYRHEAKHLIGNADMLALRTRLRAVMKPDPNPDGTGVYAVRSVYFDDYEDSALAEKIDGVRYREKWRVRTYNDDTDLIRLEKKVKRDGMSEKHAAFLTKEQAERILAGELGWIRETGDPVLHDFLAAYRGKCLKPRTVVDYVREAYVFPAGNVRVTFDRSVRTGLASTDLFDRSLPTVETLPSGTSVLEVKFDGFLPSVIAGAIQLGDQRAVAVSKYALSRSFL
jgi:hypothetical protein